MKKQLIALVTAAASIASLQAQTTIVNYSTGGTNVPGSTGYFNTSEGWTGGITAWQGQGGGVPLASGTWGGSGAGGSFIDNYAGYTPGGAGNNSGSIGLEPSLPTSLPITLNRSFTPMPTATFTNITVSFVAEFSVFDLGIPTVNNDAFVFDLNAGGLSALAFNLQAGTGGSGDYAVTTGGGIGSSIVDLFYDSVYSMQIDITGTSWTGTFYEVQFPSGARNFINPASFSGSLANGLSASQINNLEIEWVVESGDVNDLGTVALIANEFTITSTGDPIPEPGTWAMAALLISGAAATIYRRRKVQGEEKAA
jgi:hypothetical protein